MDTSALGPKYFVANDSTFIYLPAKLLDTSSTPCRLDPSSTPTTRFTLPIFFILLKWSTTLSSTNGCTTTFDTFDGSVGGIVAEICNIVTIKQLWLYKTTTGNGNIITYFQSFKCVVVMTRYTRNLNIDFGFDIAKRIVVGVHILSSANSSIFPHAI